MATYAECSRCGGIIAYNPNANNHPWAHLTGIKDSKHYPTPNHRTIITLEDTNNA